MADVVKLTAMFKLASLAAAALSELTERPELRGLCLAFVLIVGTFYCTQRVLRWTQAGIMQFRKRLGWTSRSEMERLHLHNEKRQNRNHKWLSELESIANRKHRDNSEMKADKVRQQRLEEIARKERRLGVQVAGRGMKIGE